MALIGYKHRWSPAVKNHTCSINFKDQTDQIREEASSLKTLKQGWGEVDSGNLRKYVQLLVQIIAKPHLEYRHAQKEHYGPHQVQRISREAGETRH